MATASLTVFIVTRGRVDNGADEMRLIVKNMDATRESFNQAFTSEQLLQIFRMQLASGWDFSPDQWTPRQVKEALQGITPAWNEEEEPIYSKRLAKGIRGK